MIKWPLMLYLWVVAPVALAQQWTAPAGLNSLIASIDSNNTTLKALRSGVTAQKMENRTDLNPPDPTVGVNYLRPNPRVSDRRLDFSISQEFEFPTVYGLRRQVANRQNEALDITFQLQRQEILEEAVRTWLQWLYYQEYRSILQLQNRHAQQIATSYQRAFDAGQINILDRNKARLHAVMAQKAYDLNEIEIKSTYDQLQRLNGGKSLSGLGLDPDAQTTQHFPNWEVPGEIDTWLAHIQGKSMLVNAIEKDLEVARTQEKLATAMQLPNLEIGFMREQDIEVDFRGVTLGVSIPLWHHRNRRNHARLQTVAQQNRLFDTSQQFEQEQINLFRKATALKRQLNELRAVLENTSSPELMRKALDLGEITLVDYLVEQQLYYELMETTLQTELEYQFIQAEMWKWLYSEQ